MSEQIRPRRRRMRGRNGVALIAGLWVAVGVGGYLVVAPGQTSDRVVAQSATLAAGAADRPADAVLAADFDAQKGAKTEPTGDAGGGRNVGWLANGDWLRFDDVDLGPAGSVTTSLRLAAAYADRAGRVEVRLGSRKGDLVASIDTVATGGWQTWATASDTKPSPGGVHDVFLVLRSAQAGDFVNLNWFAFGARGVETPAPPHTAHPTPPSTPTPSGSASASPSPTHSMPGMQPPKPGDWMPVDEELWAAQLADFRTRKQTPLPAQYKANTEFNATCKYSHSAKDDPIVFPGRKGASHMHSFVGNEVLDANTTFPDLMRFTASSCKPAEDHSAYWIPTLYENDKPVEPKEVVVYYGSLLDDKTKTVPMPQGLRMIAGDASKQVPTPRGAQNQFYCAGGPVDGATRSADGNWPVCGEGGTLHFTMRFPDCWDGKHLDSPTHKGHVSYGGQGKCPAAFPVPIPAVTFVLTYPTGGSAAGFRLASGLPSSMHGDVFAAWEIPAMNQRVKDCVIRVVTCNTAGEM